MESHTSCQLTDVFINNLLDLSVGCTETAAVDSVWLLCNAALLHIKVRL